MTCTRCGAANAAGRKFCLDCGAPLALACPSCGAGNEPAARFCGECGTPLTGGPAPAATPTPSMMPGAPPAPGAPTPAASTTAAGTERRHVSVLFADLVGFTTLAQDRDPEAIRELLGQYFDQAREIIERYGGTVEKFIGDAVMALWGAPIAREDDAERAVRAGLDLLDAVRHLGRTAGLDGLEARAGVLSGEAAVTMGAVNQGMVAGDIVNTASRLQSVAPPGSLLVGESTFRAAAAAIAFEPAGAQLLKGKEAPVPAWRALRVVAERGGGGRSGSLESPFVGRDDELRLLKDRFHAAGRERKARLVSVTGQAGIGKSRLAWEFLKYIDGLVEDVRWHQGRSPAYGEGVSFWALGEMVRSRAGLTEGDDEATTRTAVDTMVHRFAHDEAEARWIAGPVLTLLGLSAGRPGTVAGSREELFAAWRTLFERIAEHGTTVLVFEDLQWADPGQVDFIEHLLEWSPGHPLLVVTLARPELLEKRPTWGNGRNLLALPLEPLSPDVMGELLAGLVPGLPASAAETILERAGGVPLYAVETVRMLVAEGRLTEQDGAYRPVGDLSRLDVPESLHALIAARLDALDPIDRALLHDGAVLGQTFTVQSLAAVSGRPMDELEPRLRGLVRTEMLTLDTDPRSPERGQFGFTQALVREVAYGRLARRERQVRHLAAARHFEALGDEELSGALATHYIAAWRAAGEGPEAEALAAQARVSLRAAAERAAGLGSHEQALAWLRQALEVTTAPLERAELLYRAGVAAADAGVMDVAEALLRDALAESLAAGDRSAAARTVERVANVLLGAYRTSEAVELLAQAECDYADLADDPGLAGILGQLARARFFEDDFAASLEVAEKALTLAERIDLVSVVADAMVTKGAVLTALGRGYEGVGVLRAGLLLAEQHGLVKTRLRAALNLSSVVGKGDPQGGILVAMEALDEARRLGLRPNVTILGSNVAGMAFRLGRWALADELFAEIGAFDLPPGARSAVLAEVIDLALARAAPVDALVAELAGLPADATDVQHLANELGTRARVARRRGRLRDARELAREAARVDPWSAGTSLLLAAQVSILVGDTAGARADRDALVAQGNRGPAADAIRAGLAAGIAALEGDRDAALRGYREAADVLRSQELVLDLAQLALEALATLGPEEPVAQVLADASAADLERLGATAMLEELRAQRGASRSESPSADGGRPADRADATAAVVNPSGA